MRRVSVSDPGLSGHPQIWSEAFSAGAGMGSFGLVGFSGKDVHVARLRALGVALVLVLSAVGCEDEPEPDLADPTPSSTAPSPSESESSPTTSPTPEALSPEETVRAWVDARNQALQDGDTAALRGLSFEQCETCEEHIKPIEDVFAAGGSFDTPGWTVDNVAEDGVVRGETRLNAAVTMAGGQTVPAAGQEPVSYPEDKRIMVFRVLQETDGSTRVSFIGYIS